MNYLILSAGTLFLLLVPVNPSSLYGQGKNSSSAEAKSIVRRVAENFGRNYAKNYVAFVETIMDVKSNGTYIQFMAQDAIAALLDFNQKTGDLLFDEWNAIRYTPLEQYVTELIIPGSHQYLKRKRNAVSVKNYFDSYYVNYDNDFDTKIFARQTALHKYSPLNVKMIDNYSYRLESKGKDGYIIWFKTAKGFPKPMRIHAEGRLYIDADMTVKSVEVINMEDRYSNFFYDNSKVIHTTVCDYSYRVDYKRLGSVLVTKEINESVIWKEPENKTEDIYFSPCPPPYKHPFKYNISTNINICFSLHITGLPKEDCTELKKYFLSGESAPMLGYITSVNIDYWRKKWTRLRSKQQIQNDLATTQEGLDKQAVEVSKRYSEERLESCVRDLNASELSKEDIEHAILVRKEMQNIGLQVYQALYGKDFYGR